MTATYIDITPTDEGFRHMKLAFQQSVESYKHQVQEIDNYVAENDELSYVIESALYAGVDVLEGHIKKLNEAIMELERCGY